MSPRSRQAVGRAAAPLLSYSLDQGGDSDTLRLQGSVSRPVARQLARLLARHRPAARGRLLLDLSAVEELDSAAVAVLVHGWRLARLAGGSLVLGPVSPAAERSLSMFRTKEQVVEAPRRAGALERLGESTIDGAFSLRDLLILAADTSAGLLRVLRHPGRLRGAAVIEQAIYIGSQALPIVGLIAFLVGLTLAFQSAYQLRQFGAAIFVANLTGVAIVREMGPLMTAILVAGRSGSSIAAEISTMKVSEEIDALQVMGLDPLEFLAVPRLLAILLTVPLLTTLADVLGILGGFIVGVVYLDISPVAFIDQTLSSLVPKDLVTGLLKSVAFAWGIGLIGLFYGFRVRGGAAEVGRTTTSSVVAAIFFIIVADCLFSVLFYILI